MMIFQNLYFGENLIAIFNPNQEKNEKMKKGFGAGTFDDDSQPIKKNILKKDEDVQNFFAEQHKRRR